MDYILDKECNDYQKKYKPNPFLPYSEDYNTFFTVSNSINSSEVYTLKIYKKGDDKLYDTLPFPKIIDRWECPNGIYYIVVPYLTGNVETVMEGNGFTLPQKRNLLQKIVKLFYSLHSLGFDWGMDYIEKDIMIDEFSTPYHMNLKKIKRLDVKKIDDSFENVYQSFFTNIPTFLQRMETRYPFLFGEDYRNISSELWKYFSIYYSHRKQQSESISFSDALEKEREIAERVDIYLSEEI